MTNQERPDNSARGEPADDKQLYRQLRRLSCLQLWEEAARFDRGAPPERLRRVALVRAIGVVFSESGTPEQKEQARQWLRPLLNDSCEKIRRYAMAAMPKLGAGAAEEHDLLALLRTTTLEREKKHLAQTLEKIGGVATLEQIQHGAPSRHLQTEQKVKASLARRLNPSEIRLDAVLKDIAGMRIHLRSRRGLEPIVRAEVEEYVRRTGKFQVADVHSGLVAITPKAAFTLADIYGLRCFGTLSFVLGVVRRSPQPDNIENLAAAITAPASRRLLESLTQGAIRYRLDFVAKGHQRSAVRLLANRVYQLFPQILNDARDARWEIAIYPEERGDSVELRPRLARDPRFAYRQDDVPAASHPPLAACMARLAGRMDDDVVWDPFCGSGLELIERAMLGGVRRLFGSDRSPEAIAIARQNFAAAKLQGPEPDFTCCDFRQWPRLAGLRPNSLSLVITNPPMGNRVPVPNLRGLIEDLFSVAAATLRPGGRLVFVNPLRIDSPQRCLRLQSRQVIDLGGFDCRLEKYVKSAG